jgi:hydroxymethylpyrimidine pyrophosphatase-like HAD family hydrolase
MCPVLAVDLDGTLLRSDMLHETLWGALAVRSRLLGDGDPSPCSEGVPR